MHSSPWITALQACQLTQHLSTFLSFTPPLSPPVSAFTTLGAVFPPRRLISDDIRCDGLLALIRLSHDFMTLILPLEQNPLLYFDPVDGIFGSIYIHKGARLKANLKSNTDIIVSYPASERFISRERLGDIEISLTSEI